MILWLRASSLDYVKKQRELDRCIYRTVRSRCLLLSDLSSSNKLLRQLLHYAVAAKTAKKLSKLIPVPGLNATVFMLGEGAHATLQTIGQGIAQSQDAMIRIEQLSALRSLRCGLPVKPALPMGVDRRPALEAVLSDMPSPLSWSKGPHASEIEARLWRDPRIQSFAYCQPDATPAAGEWLAGEKYKPVFERPPPAVAKPLSKLSSLLPPSWR